VVLVVPNVEEDIAKKKKTWDIEESSWLYVWDR